MPIEIESPEQLGYDKVKFNLTESSVSDTVFQDLKTEFKSLKLAYSDHLGKPELRQWIANDAGAIHPDEVLITAGAAAALFIAATSILEKEDHLIVIRPNYASNIETPRAIGCEISYCELEFEKDFAIDVETIRQLIRPNTKLISITHPHNPTGMVIPEETMKQLATLVAEHKCYLLVDETYRDLNFNSYPLTATLHERIISVSSVSKAYGLPGLRIGWMITRDKKLFEKFLAAKEQIFVCNSILDEEIAFQFLSRKEFYFDPIKEHIRLNRQTLTEWFQTEKRMDVMMPSGGVVCFPRVKDPGKIDLANFYNTLNQKYGTYVGPGHWFEMPDHYMRIGFGWPSNDELDQGLKNISRTLDEI